MKLRTRVSTLIKSGRYEGTGLSPIIDVQRATQAIVLLDVGQNGGAPANVSIELLVSAGDSEFYHLSSLGNFDSETQRAIPLRDLGCRFLRLRWTTSAAVKLAATLMTKNLFDEFRRRREPTQADKRRAQLRNRPHKGKEQTDGPR